MTVQNVTEVPYEPAISLSDTYPTELKTYVHTKAYKPMFAVALFIMCYFKKVQHLSLYLMVVLIFFFTLHSIF